MIVLLLALQSIVVHVDQTLNEEGMAVTRVYVEAPSRVNVWGLEACYTNDTVTLAGSTKPPMVGVRVDVDVWGDEAPGLIEVSTPAGSAQAALAWIHFNDTRASVEAVLRPVNGSPALDARLLQEALSRLPFAAEARVGEAGEGYRARITLELPPSIAWGKITGIQGILEPGGAFNFTVEAEGRIWARGLLRTILAAGARDILPGEVLSPLVELVMRSRTACIKLGVSGVTVNATLVTYSKQLEDILPRGLLRPPFNLTAGNIIEEPQGPSGEGLPRSFTLTEPGVGMIAAMAGVLLLLTPLYRILEQAVRRLAGRAKKMGGGLAQ